MSAYEQMYAFALIIAYNQIWKLEINKKYMHVKNKNSHEFSYRTRSDQKTSMCTTTEYLAYLWYVIPLFSQA